MAKSLTSRSATFLEEEGEEVKVAEDRVRIWEERDGRRWIWEVSFWSVENDCSNSKIVWLRLKGLLPEIPASYSSVIFVLFCLVYCYIFTF